jgi:hypothetical protein
MEWLKAKYRKPKRKGKYRSTHDDGRKPGVLRRGKKGPKTYVYGSRVLVMGPTGKTHMEGREVQ